MTAFEVAVVLREHTVSIVDPGRVIPVSKTASFCAERIDGAEPVVAAIDAAGTAVVSGAFQSRCWLDALYRTLAKDLGAAPVAIRVTDEKTGDLAFLLPLVQTQQGRLRVLSFPLLGVSDYGGPILGSKPPIDITEITSAWRAMLSALDGADLLRLQNMPAVIGAKPNPLVTPLATPSRHHANSVVVEDTVDALLRARGKKYRKEAERCYRLLMERGTPEFRRAETPDEISKAYAVLQEQQAARRREAGGDYLLERGEYARFYEQVLLEGRDTGAASLFTLRAGGDVCAALLGVTHGTSFTLLRISTAGEDWKRVSPGRLIVLETMRALVAQGVRTFDMGIGDYAFKHGFGTEAAPLYDLEMPLTWSAAPAAAIARAKARLRQSPRLKAWADRLRERS